MKTTFTFLLLGALLCGCSKKHAALPSGPPARDLVVAGKDVAWSDGYILHVAKRDGDLLEGIHVVHKDASGKVATITADAGSIQPGIATMRVDGVLVSTNVVTIILQDAQFQGVTTQTIKELTLDLHQ